jgi:hypothetical protein
MIEDDLEEKGRVVFKKTLQCVGCKQNYILYCSDSNCMFEPTVYSHWEEKPGDRFITEEECDEVDQEQNRRMFDYAVEQMVGLCDGCLMKEFVTLRQKPDSELSHAERHWLRYLRYNMKED